MFYFYFEMNVTDDFLLSDLNKAMKVIDRHHNMNACKQE
jgi:hypothetical protein